MRQLRLEGGPGLRGLTSLVMPFPYPLTVICGRNGVGKSTVLALTALSARPPADWGVYWGNTRPRTRPDTRLRYEFGDFFHRQRGVPKPNGLRLTWVLMDRGNELEIIDQMEGGRWVSVADAGRHRRPGNRPVREIDYIPMSRILPASEFGVLRAAFNGEALDRTETLDGSSLTKLSYIMGRHYERAEIRYVRGLGLSACTAGADYSGFDMGSGENSLIVLLSRLQAARRGSLLVIEEIELGLHPEAQERLMQVLISCCLERKVQIVCTTHSEVVIDAVPRRARVLLRRNGAEHEALDNVSTRFAVHEMMGRLQPELMVYTEDTFAGLMVEESLAGPQRARISVHDVGSNVTLARQAVAHLRMAPQLRALSTFDGDCTEAQVNRWIAEESAERDLRPEWLILPGDGLAPERWLVRELAAEAYRDALGRELNCTPAIAAGHIQAMQVQLDHHDCGHVLAQRTGLKPAAARRSAVRAVARSHPALQPLRDRIIRLLEHAEPLTEV
ncbi:ATP-dependent nuclease [Azospirillum sp. ST 5-10]|uniref:ATP-dependent nuclease n=1 Tax=unclassified Azospirillum TaxID=2630922 RepID=UPI003F4A71E0